MEEEPEVPVWYKGAQKWITGLTRRTTCDDVIYAVMCDSCARHVDLAEYAMWERWRGVERPLRGRTKVLKLWSAWQRMTDNVQLVIRRVESVADSSSEVSSRKVRRRTSRQRRNKASETPVISEEFAENRKSYLLKVVAERDIFIRNQELRMQALDDDISAHEDRIHRLRMLRKGQNYLQEAYLRPGEESGSPASSNEDYQLTEYTRQLETYLDLCSKVLAAQEKLEQAQQRAAELSQHIAEESTGVEDLREQLKEADAVHDRQEQELSVLDVSIKECDDELSKRRSFYQELTEDSGDVPVAQDKPKTVKNIEDFQPYITS
jgi:Ras association domain-containing protein 9/10